MNRIPRARHSKEMRQEAVALAKAVGPAEASRRLSIPMKTLANWLRAANAGKLEEAGRQQPVIAEAELELALVKRKLAGVKMGRAVLKKFAAYFAKSRGEVPGYGATATSVSTAADVPAAWRVGQRLLRLAHSQTVAAHNSNRARKQKYVLPIGAREKRAGRNACRKIWLTMA